MRERVEVSCILVLYRNRIALMRFTYRPIRKHPHLISTLHRGRKGQQQQQRVLIDGDLVIHFPRFPIPSPCYHSLTSLTLTLLVAFNQGRKKAN